jgi:hypothetical protein
MAAEQIDKAGGRALPLVVDIRDEERVAERSGRADRARIVDQDVDAAVRSGCHNLCRESSPNPSRASLAGKPSGGRGSADRRGNL